MKGPHRLEGRRARARFRERRITEYPSRRSFGFDARGLHHLAPLLGFTGDERAELGGRHRHRHTTEVGWSNFLASNYQARRACNHRAAPPPKKRPRKAVERGRHQRISARHPKKNFCGIVERRHWLGVDTCLLNAPHNRCIPVRRKDRRRSPTFTPHTPAPPGVPFPHASTDRSVIFQGDVQLSEKRK
jgi:hypothetical protein